MSYKISKELFEKVMKVELAGFSINEENVIGYIFNKIGYFEISVDTFFFKCKEWLIGRGYDNWSGYHENEYFCYVKTKGTFISNSEQQAVFDACQWVLDNKEK